MLFTDKTFPSHLFSDYFAKYCNFAIAGEIRSGMDKMRRAFEIYPYCTLALNHLANHYFFTGQHFVVEQLSETALSSSSHGLLKAQSYYNLARSYHSKVMYPIHIPIELVGHYITCSPTDALDFLVDSLVYNLN